MTSERSFLNFVRPKSSFSEEFGQGSRNNKKNDGNQGTLTGTIAKEFYRSVITTPSNVTERNRKDSYSKTKEHESVNHEETNVAASRRKRSSSLSESKTRKAKERRPEKIPSEKTDKESSFGLTSRLVNKFLHYAQEGQLRDLKKLLLERDIDVNVTDQFSWTALMCATHSGKTNVVRYLLDKGALWKGVVNSQGKTALDLAREANNSTIVKLLQEIEESKVAPKYHKPKSAAVKPFWCGVCKQEFTEDEKKHKSSTVHQFNCQHKPRGPYFSIAEDNPGYKLMVKSGWDEERGLGPEGKGRKFPIKTVLKRDRYGLGNEMSSKARVTHFGPNDQDAVKIKKEDKKDGRKETNRTLSKKQKRLKESKEKAWERNMRIYMNS